MSRHPTRLLIPVLCCVAFGISVAGAGEAPRPNIIIVMADDMGFSDPGCYGGEITTPTIDRLAAEGLRFSQFYNCNKCGPSRASLMTGAYPWKVGQASGQSIFRNLTGNCVTIPQLLKAAGYTTAAVGRLDMVTADDWHDPDELARTLDRFLGSASGGPGNYYREARGTPWFRDGKRWKRPEGDYSTNLISDFAVDFIEGTNGSESPFFLYISHYAPHWPLQAEEEDIAPYRELYRGVGLEDLMKARLQRQVAEGLIPEGTALHESMVNAKPPAGGYLAVERMAIHAAMVETIDRSLARIMAALDDAGKQENTLVLVFSDNGASHQMAYDRGKVPEGVRPGSADSFLNQGPAVAALNNVPFRNFKSSDYEGGIASALIAWWPSGLVDRGRITNRLTHIADLMPTCLDLAGAEYPATFEGRRVIPLDGKSFASVLRGGETEPELPRVLAFPDALREGDWKLLKPSSGQPELYHLCEDRNESRNLAAEWPERVARMRELHQEYHPRP